jgi:hypothetical protein
MSSEEPGTVSDTFGGPGAAGQDTNLNAGNAPNGSALILRW